MEQKTESYHGADLTESYHGADLTESFVITLITLYHSNLAFLYPPPSLSFNIVLNGLGTPPMVSIVVAAHVKSSFIHSVNLQLVSLICIQGVYIYLLLVMQRFVNLKVGSVFGFLHPETAFQFSIFKKKII